VVKTSLPASVVVPFQGEGPVTEFAARAKAAWARLIRKVYESDPLECPKCKGPMRVIALIEDPRVIRRTLERLGFWAPLAIERSPPPSVASWPRHATLPLTYHPVPTSPKNRLETPEARDSACHALAVGIDCSVIHR